MPYTPPTLGQDPWGADLLATLTDLNTRVLKFTAAQATTTNPVLTTGQLGVETDTGKIKVGNGTTTWNLLPYSGSGASTGVPNGGTVGQVLAKLSSTNGDATWQTFAPTGGGLPTGGTTGQVLSKLSSINSDAGWQTQTDAPARLPDAGIRAETAPRYGTSTAALSAGIFYYTRITLKTGSYTTVTVGVSGAGATLANAFFGLYDATSLALLATSASAVTPLQSAGLSAATMNYTVPANGDYYIGVLVGSATTAPNLVVHGIGIDALAADSPTIAQRHNATGLTTLPSTLIPMTNPSGLILPWIRYA